MFRVSNGGLAGASVRDLASQAVTGGGRKILQNFVSLVCTSFFKLAAKTDITDFPLVEN